MMIKRYYKSDFKINEIPQGGYMNTPFRFSYYTRTKEKIYVASYDGQKYTNCRRLSDGTLLVTFDNHGLSTGILMVFREFELIDADYKDGVCNYSFIDNTGIMLVNNRTNEKEEIIKVTVYPNYQKGDAMTWSTMTSQEQNELVKNVTEGVTSQLLQATPTGDETEYQDVFLK